MSLLRSPIVLISTSYNGKEKKMEVPEVRPPETFGTTPF